MEQIHLKIINGDLLKLASEGHFDYIVHGCNCFHAMNSGIAGKIAARYPEARSADKLTGFGDRNKLGKCSLAYLDNLIIVNAYTQFNYGRSSNRYFEYPAFYSFLNMFKNILVSEFKENKFRIGFPLIGCGLANGDKSFVISMLKDFAKETKDIAETTLVLFNETLS